MRLVVFILKSGLKQYLNVRDMLDDADVGFVECDKYFGPVKDYDEMMLVDSTVVSGITFSKAITKMKKIFPRAKIITAGTPKYGTYRPDVLLPDVSVSKKKIIAVVGHSGTGKSGLSGGLRHALKEPLVKWGKLVKKYYSIGKYGEGVKTDDYHLAFSLLPEIEKYYSRAREYLIIDGIKSPEQLAVLSYALLSPPEIFYVETPERIRKEIIMLRKMVDDVYDEKRKNFFDEGLKRLKIISRVIDMNSNEVPQVITEKGVRAEILERFNPYITKENLLLNYVGIAKHTKPAPFEPRVELHRGYSKRYGISELDYLTTSVRLIDDVLDEHKIRWSSEENRTYETYWWKHTIFETMIEAARLLGRFYYESGLHPFEPVLLMSYGVFKELELERSGRKPTPDDWIIAATREAFFRGWVAACYSLDVDEEVVKGFYGQAKDDVVGRRKGGRKDTDTRLNRPTYDRVFGKDYKWMKNVTLEEFFERLHASKNVQDYVHRTVIRLRKNHCS